MKVIDLLNKIANGEEVPKYIQYNGDGYYFEDSEYKDFVNGLFYEDLNGELEITEENPTLNDIRESYGLPRIEEHKIPEKLKIGVNICDEIKINNEIYGERQVKEVADKVNEIIDYLEENK